MKRFLRWLREWLLHPLKRCPACDQRRGWCERCADVGREHVDREDCWCAPEVAYVDPDTGARVLVHRRVQ